jgi:hypothetical protein
LLSFQQSDMDSFCKVLVCEMLTERLLEWETAAFCSTAGHRVTWSVTDASIACLRNDKICSFD